MFFFLNSCKRNKKQKKTQKTISRSNIIIHCGIIGTWNSFFSLFFLKKNASNLYKINLKQMLFF